MAGCKGAETQSEVKPSKLHQNFLYYTEDYEDEEGSGVGELFIKKLGDDNVDKIATDVKEYEFSYLNEDNKVLFVDSEGTLFEYESGKDKVKLAENVYTYDASTYSDGVIIYQNEDDDLYIIKIDAEVEKIASDVYQYELMDNDLYYVNYDGTFKMYNIKERTEEEIATNVESFMTFTKDGTLAYVNDDYFLYYRDGKDGESKKVFSETTIAETVQLVDKTLVYIGSDSDSSSLYMTDTTGEMTTKKIATDVRDYWYDNGTFYFINSDDNLFQKKADDDSAKKIASDVIDVTFDEQGVFYLDSEDIVYALDSKDEKKKVATDVLDYTITDEGDIIFQTTNDELFVDDKKIASDVEMYSYVYDNLIYSTTDDTLYMMEGMKEAQVVDEDLSAYHYVFYHGEMVFNNVLGFKDITGVWRSVDDDFIEIKSDGTIISILDQEQLKFEKEHADAKLLNAYNDEYEEYVIIRQVDKETLIIESDYEEVYLYKSSHSEAEKFAVEEQEASVQEEIDDLISSYVFDFEYAVNEGDSDYITDYISPTSDFYKQQVKFVQDMYEKDIYEELLNYEVMGTDKVNEDTYKVTVYEEFSIYNLDTGDETEKSFENVYTVERIDGEFFITDLKVSEI